MEKEQWKITDSIALYGFTINGHRWLSNKHMTIRDDHIDIPRIGAEQHYKGEPWATANNRPIHPGALEVLGKVLKGVYPAQLFLEIAVTGIGSEGMSFLVDSDQSLCVAVNSKYCEAFSYFFPDGYWVSGKGDPADNPVIVKDNKGEIVGAIMPFKINTPLPAGIVELLLKKSK